MEPIQTKSYKGCDINIYRDEDPDNPRNWDNVCTMVCEHRYYSFGDINDSGCIQRVFNELFTKHVPESKVIDYFIKTRNVQSITNDEGRSMYEWKLSSGIIWSVYPEEAYDEFVDGLSTGEMLRLLDESKQVVILPISIYEHSGVTIWFGSTLGHVDAQWDCSSIGFGYVEKEKALKGYGDVTEDNWVESTIQHMNDEMKIYDQYVRGEVYGYIVENEDGEEIDSCWGCYGQEGIKEIIETGKDVINCYLKRHEEELIKMRAVVSASVPLLKGGQFVHDDNLYKIDNDMFGQLEIIRARIKHGWVMDFDVINVSDIPDKTIEAMYDAISYRKRA